MKNWTSEELKPLMMNENTADNTSPYYNTPEEVNWYGDVKLSPGISYVETDVIYVKSEKEFIEIFGNPNMNFTSAPTPMSTDDLKDKIIRDLEQERHTMNDAMREKEFRASYMQEALLYVWHDLCDAYDKKSSIKEIYTHTLHYMYNMLEDHLTNCPDYATRDLTKKIKKEIEQTKIKSKEVFDDF